MWLLAATATGSAAATDTAPPQILMLPLEQQATNRPISIRARILDPSGISRAVLWARGERDDEFRSFAMSPAPDDEFVYYPY